ncbi:MAG: ROK family protein [Solirubrobacterales bacterium]|nr:ROK family protein [Solirubrobacterales bacterium]
MAGRRTIGVDIGGTKLLAGALDPTLGVHHRTRRRVTGLDQPALLDAVVDAVQETHEAIGEVEAVGFGIPCLIDQRTGIATMAVNLPLAQIPFGAVMAERLGLPVFVDNDANVTALAEHRAGAARGANEAVVLTIGTGIGGGLILRGEVYRGSIGTGAELGHMVIDVNGPRCQGNCPSNGCAEALASGVALEREAGRIAQARPESALGAALRDGHVLTGALITELAHDGDEAALEAIELIGSRLGVAISNLVNIFNPEVVVVGGGVVSAGEPLLTAARKVLAQRALPPSGQSVKVVPARFGVEAGMVGAATLAFDGIGW